MPDAVLSVSDLRVIFRIGQDRLTAVDKVSLNMAPGEHTALLGESGCGKSALALAIFGLLPKTALVSGVVRGLGFDNLLALPQSAINRLRGRAMVLIPQNPHGSLNPVFRTGRQVAESVYLNACRRPADLRSETHRLLRVAGLPDPQAVARMFPHEISGGMAQRVLLAAGLAGRPIVVVADEPTKGIDPEVRKACMTQLLGGFRESAMLLITHDLEVACVCERAAVMYAGEIVELGPGREVLLAPRHPYTQGLIRAHPRCGLNPLPGEAPALSDLPTGCRFHPRCERADGICGHTPPPLRGDGRRFVRCFHALR